MREIDPDLAAHLAGGVTTVCNAWRVTRRDDIVIGFTEHDADLSFDGTVFHAASGFRASDGEEAIGLPASASEVAGGFSSAAIREDDLIDGRYDGARIEVFLVNWTDAAQHHLMKVQEIGEVTRTAHDFRAELRSFTHRLGRNQGRIYGRGCDATLGDGRCGVDLSLAARRGAGAVLAADGYSHLSVSGLAGFAAGYFRYGMLAFETGALAGLSFDIDNHFTDTTGVAHLYLWLALPRLPQIGDAVHVTAGCDKSFATCRLKFGNGANFQGFPHLPGSDFAYSYIDGETLHDGRALFP